MEFHPVADLFPMMSTDEFEVLCLDIAMNGLREPILLADGKIADGRNRFKACMEVEVEPRFREWNGDGSLLSTVISLNLKRRHLSESQRAMVAAKLANMERGRPERNVAGATINVSQTNAGEMLQVSRDSVIRAVKIQKQGVPELIEQVESGEIKSLTQAARIASLPKESQKRLIKRGRKAAKGLLRKLQTKSIKKAYRLGCLNCDPEAKANKETISLLMQRLARKFPVYAWCFNDVAEELESAELSDETRTNYDRVLESIDLGYQTADLISSKTGIDRQHLDHTLALMIDYRMIEPKKEIKKTDQARGATKTIYQRMQRDEADVGMNVELDEVPDEEFGFGA